MSFTSETGTAVVVGYSELTAISNSARLLCSQGAHMDIIVIMEPSMLMGIGTKCFWSTEMLQRISAK